MHRSGLVELDAVLAVARRGSFRAAARELGMSTSALSHAVASLEARLQARLFNRTTRSVALTEAGARYVARIGPAVAEIRAAAEELHADDLHPSGTLRISVPRESTRMLAGLIGEFVQRCPDVRLELDADARLVDIVAEGFDAGVRLHDQVPQDMVALPLYRQQRLRVVASPGYLAAHGVPLTPDALAAHGAIRMRMSHGGLYRWELEHRGQLLQVDPPARLVVGELQAARAAALAGVGLAFLSEWHIQQELDAGTLVPVLDAWCPPFPGLYLYFPGHRHLPPPLKAFVALLRERDAAGLSPDAPARAGAAA
ncbi:LysR family transcriptional regulator [Stenotrophomonas sp. 24(2023)]|uniref:LysR family transcriptional regulator n=1 Tax=Stenotrophomonas sp. 24(2023) TaxID=3068324 RepID=UPI0027E0D694|nr:LysR family transcriptional regulator [Stenotrophomonas sp. 24(2023)]WMJ69334.1 LysR family transcriptional regulator [Stenotrophomonas sp. 24(2023)]